MRKIVESATVLFSLKSSYAHSSYSICEISQSKKRVVTFFLHSEIIISFNFFFFTLHFGFIFSIPAHRARRFYFFLSNTGFKIAVTSKSTLMPLDFWDISELLKVDIYFH